VWHWPELEPLQGQFAFEKQVRAPLEKARDGGYYTHLMLWVAPSHRNGSMRSAFPCRGTRTYQSLSAAGKTNLSLLLQPDLHRELPPHHPGLGDYIAALPAGLKERIVFIQTAEAQQAMASPTRASHRSAIQDHGEPVGQIPVRNLAVYQQAFLRADGTLRVPLLVNGDANGPEENAWLLEHCDAFG